MVGAAASAGEAPSARKAAMQGSALTKRSLASRATH